MRRITPDRSWPLFNTTASMAVERQAQASLPAHTLMQRAGLAVAKLARALAPHGRRVWIACGPGNNGGDGFEAATHLHRLGWQTHLTWTGAEHSPPDAQWARQRALAAGLVLHTDPPAEFDVCIDALLGLGADLSAQRPSSAVMREWLHRMHASAAPVLAVDLPTGLQADTGVALASPGQAPRHTLSLLSLKPGLFTGDGREHAGQVWFDDLGVQPELSPSAWLLGADVAGRSPKTLARHSGHKGRFGDVLVVGGQQVHDEGTSMAGAAVLAARAALHHGAGRVYVVLLGQPDVRVDLVQPELMFRSAASLSQLAKTQVAVVGCGGGQAVAALLPSLLVQGMGLVLDADALNAVAADRQLRHSLTQRGRTGQESVLTPHPLEAARLLGSTAAQVQADRLLAAQTLADELACVVVLKGSGTVVASPGRTPVVNATGNALLASAGTGDVLAGMVGSAMAQGLAPWEAALQAVHEHGARADAWVEQHPGRTLTASELLR
jgi:hydroxyethylthiazole kinase-like uncharacterized protein yjeF